MSVSIKFNSASVVTIDGSEYLVLKLPDFEQKAKAQKFAAEQQKPHVAELKQYRDKRSLNANAYAWVLLGKLAAVVGLTPVEIYRELIKNVGDNFEIISVREDAKDQWMTIWRERGLGWVCDELGRGKVDGYCDIVCYYGSSVYDTAQMSRLIEILVQDCHDQGVETLPPEKLNLLIEEWDERTDKFDGRPCADISN